MGQGEGMYQFPGGARLDSGGVIVIANQAVEFEVNFGFKPHYELVESDSEVPNLTKYSAWATGNIALSNTGDDVLVLNASDSVVDALSWGDSIRTQTRRVIGSTRLLPILVRLIRSKIHSSVYCRGCGGSSHNQGSLPSLGSFQLERINPLRASYRFSCFQGHCL
jgi:hypothetical protein